MTCASYLHEALLAPLGMDASLGLAAAVQELCESWETRTGLACSFRTVGACEALGDTVEVLDARADIEGLAAAIMLAQDRLAHHDRVIGQHEGAHRQAVDRRRRDDP